MTGLPFPRLDAVVAAQRGLFTTAQALDAGMHPRELRQGVRSGVWVRLRRGVYAPSALVPLNDPPARHILDARAARLTLQGPFAFSHVTAALLHDLPAHELDLGEVHVTHHGVASSGRHQSGVWHHVGGLDDARLVTCDGLQVCDLTRTVVDVARTSEPAGALVVADAARARGVTAEQLRSELEDCMDWPGARRASRLVPLADDRAESPGESIARWALHQLDLAPDELQLSISTDSGTYRVDFAWTRWRLAGEFDGKIKYRRLVRPGETAADVVWRERQRELAIERTGWGMVRFGWADVHDLGRLRYLVLNGRTRAELARASA